MLGRKLTPEEIRAARLLLGWSQDRLAAKSETTTSFVWAYEREGRVTRMLSRDPSLDGLAAIRTTLEAAGVRFAGRNPPRVTSGSSTLPKSPVLITPGQMRNARISLGWSRTDLASASKTTVNFIKGYEDHGRVGQLSLIRGSFDGIAAIHAALKKAGIVFTNGNPPGVWLRKVRR